MRFPAGSLRRYYGSRSLKPQLRDVEVRTTRRTGAAVRSIASIQLLHDIRLHLSCVVAERLQRSRRGKWDGSCSLSPRPMMHSAFSGHSDYRARLHFNAILSYKCYRQVIGPRAAKPHSGLRAFPVRIHQVYPDFTPRVDFETHTQLSVSIIKSVSATGCGAHFEPRNTHRMYIWCPFAHISVLVNA